MRPWIVSVAAFAFCLAITGCTKDEPPEVPGSVLKQRLPMGGKKMEEMKKKKGMQAP